MAKKYLGNWNGVPVYTDYLPYGTRRPGRKLSTGKPVFAVAHDTGNLNSTAQQNVNFYRNTYNEQFNIASAHFFVDDKECVICIPIDEVAYHVLPAAPMDNIWYGHDANYAAFGGEACYFSDKQKSQKSLDNFSRVMAALCKSWNINPVNQMPGHQQIQFDKQDPGNLLDACGYDRNDIHIIDNLVVKYMQNANTKVKKYIYNWKGKFTAHKDNDDPIVVRTSPGMNGKIVEKNSWIKPGEYVPFDQIIKKDGYWWLRFKYVQKGSSKNDFYMPIGKIEEKHERIKNEKNLWGKLEVK